MPKTPIYACFEDKKLIQPWWIESAMLVPGVFAIFPTKKIAIKWLKEYEKHCSRIWKVKLTIKRILI